jgi:hypothetical protein
LILLILASLPYLTGYFSQTDDQVFSGTILDRQDIAVHLATMHGAKEGGWQYNFRFTTENHRAAFVKMGYIFLGKIAGWTRAGVLEVYHISRVVLGLFVLVGLYYLGAEFLDKVFSRRIFLILVAGGSGLGWLQLLTGWIPHALISPIDFWLIDPYLFFSLMLFPHFLLIDLGLVLIFVLFLRQIRYPGPSKLTGLIGLLAVMQLIQPYSLFFGAVIMGGILAGTIIFSKGGLDRGMLASAGTVLIAQAPLLIHNWGVFYRRPFWNAFSNQNLTLSPPLVYYGWGFGFLWVLAGLGIYLWVRSAREQKEALVTQAEQSDGAILTASIAWMILALLAAYAPLGFQRRMIHFYVLPLSVLGAAGLERAAIPWMERRFSGPGQRWIKPAVLFAAAAVCFSSFYLSAGTSLFISQRPDRYFDQASEVRAVDYLRINANIQDTVLCSESSGMLVAGRSGQRVFLGHPMETMRYDQKVNLVASYFQGEVGLDQLDNCCDWLILGPAERQLGSKFSREEWLLAEVFQDTLLYKRNPDP